MKRKKGTRTKPTSKDVNIQQEAGLTEVGILNARVMTRLATQKLRMQSEVKVTNVTQLLDAIAEVSILSVHPQTDEETEKDSSHDSGLGEPSLIETQRVLRSHSRQPPVLTTVTNTSRNPRQKGHLPSPVTFLRYPRPNDKILSNSEIPTKWACVKIPIRDDILCLRSKKLLPDEVEHFANALDEDAVKQLKILYSNLQLIANAASEVI